MATTYSISDLAREFDLTTRAMRFYEDMGLLQPERSGPGGRNRVYSGRDRTRLKLTLRAKRLGLSLSEAKEIIDMYDSPRDTGVQLQKFLDVLAEEARIQMVGFYDLHVWARKHRREAPSFDDVFRRIHGTRTHFSPTGLKTNLNQETIFQRLTTIG